MYVCLAIRNLASRIGCAFAVFTSTLVIAIVIAISIGSNIHSHTYIHTYIIHRSIHTYCTYMC